MEIITSAALYTLTTVINLIWIVTTSNTNSVIFSELQKLEREARICRKLNHSNIGKRSNNWVFNYVISNYFLSITILVSPVNSVTRLLPACYLFYS